jgi:hypothetical protein
MLWRFAKQDDVLSVDSIAQQQWEEIIACIHQSMPPGAATPEALPPGLCNCLGCIAAVACIAAERSEGANTPEQSEGALESSAASAANAGMTTHNDTTAQAARPPELAPPVRAHGDSMHCRIDWINRMWDRRHQWARRYILAADALTLDIRSSQRCESINSRFANFTDRGMTLCKSLEVLNKMEDTSRVTYRDNVRIGLNYCFVNMQCYKPFLNMLRGKVTQYAYHKCEQEALRADKYENKMLHVLLCCIFYTNGPDLNSNCCRFVALPLQVTPATDEQTWEYIVSLDASYKNHIDTDIEGEQSLAVVPAESLSSGEKKKAKRKKKACAEKHMYPYDAPVVKLGPLWTTGDRKVVVMRQFIGELTNITVTCSCNYPVTMRAPCRHLLCVMSSYPQVRPVLEPHMLRYMMPIWGLPHADDVLEAPPLLPLRPQYYAVADVTNPPIATSNTNKRKIKQRK